MTERPDWVRCAVVDGSVDKTKVWCRRLNPGLTFESANHALLNGRTASKLMLCTECAVAIKESLLASTYRPKRNSKPRAQA